MKNPSFLQAFDIWMDRCDSVIKGEIETLDKFRNLYKLSSYYSEKYLYDINCSAMSYVIDGYILSFRGEIIGILYKPSNEEKLVLILENRFKGSSALKDSVGYTIFINNLYVVLFDKVLPKYKDKLEVIILNDFKSNINSGFLHLFVKSNKDRIIGANGFLSKDGLLLLLFSYTLMFLSKLYTSKNSSKCSSEKVSLQNSWKTCFYDTEVLKDNQLINTYISESGKSITLDLFDLSKKVCIDAVECFAKCTSRLVELIYSEGEVDTNIKSILTNILTYKKILCKHIENLCKRQSLFKMAEAYCDFKKDFKAKKLRETIHDIKSYIEDNK